MARIMHPRRARPTQGSKASTRRRVLRPGALGSQENPIALDTDSEADQNIRRTRRRVPRRDAVAAPAAVAPRPAIAARPAVAAPAAVAPRPAVAAPAAVAAAPGRGRGRRDPHVPAPSFFRVGNDEGPTVRFWAVGSGGRETLVTMQSGAPGSLVLPAALFQASTGVTTPSTTAGPAAGRQIVEVGEEPPPARAPIQAAPPQRGIQAPPRRRQIEAPPRHKR